VKFLLDTKVLPEARKRGPDSADLRATRAAARPGSAFAEFLLGGT
jgi:hypothetical protein